MIRYYMELIPEFEVRPLFVQGDYRIRDDSFWTDTGSIFTFLVRSINILLYVFGSRNYC